MISENFIYRILTKQQRAFTLVELLIVVAILAVVILGLLETFLVGSILADLANRKTIAFSEAQDKLEEIKNHTYSLITTNYAAGGTPGNTFDLTQISGKGVITIDASDAALLKVNVVVCFSYRNNRKVGEDKNLNGVLDAGEDANGNGVIDSPIKLSTYFRSS